MSMMVDDWEDEALGCVIGVSVGVRVIRLDEGVIIPLRGRIQLAFSQDGKPMDAPDTIW